jgi:hypothetical protein
MKNKRILEMTLQRKSQNNSNMFVLCLSFRFAQHDVMNYKKTSVTVQLPWEKISFDDGNVLRNCKQRKMALNVQQL